MKKLLYSTLSLVLLSALSSAQNPAEGANPQGAPSPNTIPAGTLLPTELAKSLDAKKLKPGDPVTAKVTQDMLSRGQIVIPRDSKVIGHVTEAKARSKDANESQISIVFDKIVMKGGRELPLNAIIQAVGRPVQSAALQAMTETPAAGMPAPAQTSGAGGMGQPRTMPGNDPSGHDTSNYPGGEVNAPAQTGTPPLSGNAQGVQGLPDITLKAEPQGSVISSQKSNVKLDSGTQLLLRVNPK